MNRRMDSRFHGNDGKRPPPTWERVGDRNVPHPFQERAREGLRGREDGFPLLLSFPRKRESIFSWGGGLAHMNRRMDSRLHGNDGNSPPPTWERAGDRNVPPPFQERAREGLRGREDGFRLLLSFPRKRESIFSWGGRERVGQECPPSVSGRGGGGCGWPLLMYIVSSAWAGCSLPGCAWGSRFSHFFICQYGKDILCGGLMAGSCT